MAQNWNRAKESKFSWLMTKKHQISQCTGILDPSILTTFYMS